MSRDLSVVALVAAYNEADVIESVVRDLIANGVSVYLIDDGSTDDTVRLVEPLVGSGILRVERLAAPPDDGGGARKFAWERLLHRKAQLAAELDADWFIHHDADEFRESPWAGAPLLESIRRVDALGYNAIDFASLDFWPTHDGFTPRTDPRDAFPWYSEGATYDRVQVRCWRKAPKVDLASSGGHDVQFDNRRVFPIRFISRHYPIRGQAHGERKIFVERRPRFLLKERARNWHVQYDGVQENASFIRDRCELTRYDGDAVRMTLALRNRDVEALEVCVEESKAALDSARCERQAARDDSLLVRAALDSRVMELGETRAQLTHLHGALHVRNVELGEVHAQLGQVHAELAGVRQTVEEYTRENNALHQEVARRDDQLSQLRAALEQQTVVIAKARTHADLRDRQFASQALELVSMRAGLKDARGQLDAVQQSWSWKLTAPARVLLRWMRGY